MRCRPSTGVGGACLRERVMLMVFHSMNALIIAVYTLVTISGSVH